MQVDNSQLYAIIDILGCVEGPNQHMKCTKFVWTKKFNNYETQFTVKAV